MRHVVVEPPSLRAGDWRYWPELGQCHLSGRTSGPQALKYEVKTWIDARA